MAFQSSDSAHVATPNPVLLRDEILQELVDIASTTANAQFDSLTTRLADALQRSTGHCPDAAHARLAATAANLLKKNRYPFCYVISERLRASLQHEVRLAMQPPFTQRESGGAPKPLPPDQEIDKKLCFIKVGRAIESEHTERLTLLGRRLACLLERDELALAHNPFRPHVFLSAMHDAWCEFHPDAEAHHLLFPLLQPNLCLDMAPILHALNAALVRRGVMSRPAASATRDQPADDAVARKLRHLFPSDAAAADVDRPLAGAFPALFQDAAPQASVTRDALFGYLANAQNSMAMHHPSGAPVLAEIRQQARPGMLTPSDETTFDLLIGVFDTVFRDADIPTEIGALIGSLQLPLLKAALADKDFFFTPGHPARRAIELLARAGVEWDRETGQADPLYQAIRHGVERIRQQADPQPAAFSGLVAELESLLDEERRATGIRLAAPIAQALQREKLQQAARAARDEVALRVGTGEVVAFVETFLEDKWVAVLTLAYGVKDEKPQVAASAVRTMDDLVWSVKPKITMAERKELLAKLPSMLAMLNKWLDLIKWNETERRRFFAELAACHASIVRAPLELTPERQAEIAIEAAKQATERRLQKRLSQQPEPEPDEFDRTVRTLESGTWLAFTQHDGTVRKIRLAWTSPMRSLYIFATRERQEALSLSADELAQALREQRARIVTVAGLVGRAIAAALGVDSANAARLDDQSAA